MMMMSRRRSMMRDKGVLLRRLLAQSIVLVTALITLVSVQAQKGDIRRPPRLIKFPIESKTFRIDSEDGLVLECEADGSPPPEYYWLKDGQSLNYGGRIMVVTPGSGTIRIQQLGSIDAGSYQCFVTNQYGTTMSRIVRLERAMLANYLVKSVTESGQKEGDPYMMPCVPTKWFPKPSFSWAVINSMDDDTERQIVMDKRVQMDDSGNLQFSYLVPSDAQGGRVYKCKLFNPILDVTFGGSYAKLSVQSVGGVRPFPPAIKFSSSSPVLGLEGKDVSLRCFFSGNPEPSNMWRFEKGTGSLPIGRTVLTNFNTELTLQNLTSGDAGKYNCTGQNTQGLTVQPIELKVEAIPVFRRPEDGPLDVNVTDGDTVVISCDAYAIPQASVVWMRNGEILKPTSLPPKFRLSENGRKLTIQDVCRDCEGGSSDLAVIQCNASNVHGYAFADGYVNVLKKTTMPIRPNNMTLVADKEIVQFDFDGESDDSTPVLMKWFKVNDEHKSLDELKTSTDGDVSIYVGADGTLRLTLPVNSTRRLKYAGHYVAKADNEYSSVSSNVYLQIEIPQIIAEDAPIIAATASLFDMWWIIVIVAAVLLLLILILCCCICCRRNRGDIYLVDKEERKVKDNTLDKEIEDSGFHEYSRPDGKQGNPISYLNSINKLEDDSDESHDDVSLDYGHEDAGKYTEDGSFIGDYNEENKRGKSYNY